MPFIFIFLFACLFLICCQQISLFSLIVLGLTVAHRYKSDNYPAIAVALIKDMISLPANLGLLSVAFWFLHSEI